MRGLLPGIIQSVIRLLVCLLVAGLLWGCGSKVQDMHNYYQAGQYLEAGRSAVQALKDPALAAQAAAFMQAHGAYFLEKALYQADVLIKVPDENPILYLKALISVLEELKLLPVEVPGLNAGIAAAESKLKQATARYLQNEYAQALFSLKQQYYRDTVAHTRNVMRYDALYTPTCNALLNTAFQQASRRISLRIAPPAMQRLDVYDIDLYKKLNQGLIKELQEKKSEFLRFILDSPAESLDNAEYVVEGTIDANVYDSPPQISTKSEWVEYSYVENGDVKNSSCKIDYALFTVEFRIILYVHVAVYTAKTHTKIASISFEKAASDKACFRSVPSNLPVQALHYKLPDAFMAIPKTDTLNRALITEKAIQASWEKLASELLNTLDKDMPK